MGSRLMMARDGGVHIFTVTTTLPLLLVQPPMEHVAVYVLVEEGATDLDGPVPNPSDQVIVPPLQPFAVNIELPPVVVIVDATRA